ncbi:CAP domain-containing protein [Streptomyces sp. NBC_00467]|uniref:CAP domain-containing protein n=1 Tax=Streptomyces sp. NBC_00467 TaxID=2975752 RepID=UPI003FA76837
MTYVSGTIAAAAVLALLTAPTHADPLPPIPRVYDGKATPTRSPNQLPSWWPPHQPPAGTRPAPHGSPTVEGQRSSGGGKAPARPAPRAIQLQDAWRNLHDSRTAVIRLVNHRRTEAGCPVVHEHHVLTGTAARHSNAMARARDLSHTIASGSSPARRVETAGYRYSHLGEVIAVGQQEASEAVAAWMNSRAHRAIILTCRHRHVGVGVTPEAGGPWWTLLLAAPR